MGSAYQSHKRRKKITFEITKTLPDGSEELYAHSKDPEERTNLASKSEYAKVIADHAKCLPKVNVLPVPGSAGSGTPLYPEPKK